MQFLLSIDVAAHRRDVTVARAMSADDADPCRSLPDSSGALVGFVFAKLDAIKVMLASDDLPQNVNFAVKAAMVAAFLDANRVAYKVGAPGTALPPADIADQARAMSGFVVCR